MMMASSQQAFLERVVDKILRLLYWFFFRLRLAL